MPRPKGRPFTPGDKRINRAGRPPLSDCLSDCLREVASQPAGGGMTHAQKLARVIFRKAEGGDMRAATLIADRLEGKPGQRVEVQAGSDLQPLIVNLGTSLAESAALMQAKGIPRAEIGGKRE